MTLLPRIAALADAQRREAAAAELGACLGGAVIVLLVQDPQLQLLLPARGMAGTLRGGAQWSAFVQRCRDPGWQVGQVDLPAGSEVRAQALCGHRIALVLLGGRELQEEERRELEAALPLLGAALATELEVEAARAEAAESREAALRAHSLARTLDTSRAEGARLNAELREEHRRKDEFLAMLAHELRNPLAPIVTSVQVLKHPALPEDRRRRQMAVIERQAEQLSRLVEDLLDVSRVSRGLIDLQRKTLDLHEVLRAAVDTTESLMLAKSQELRVSLPAEPLLLEADNVRLTQVFANLLHNAAKYTDTGGHIDLIARREGDAVVVSVRDDGVGIPAELLPRVFDLFMQAPVTLDRSQGGLGIGLTLVRLLVQLHGGEVTAASDGTGQGSCFTVRLPLARDAGVPSPSEGGTGVAPASASEPLRVLLVDDNRDAADALAEMLRLLGHSVRCAYNGATALALGPDIEAELVLLDLGLPGMDGYEVARRLRQAQRQRSYLVALTGYGAERDRRLSKEAGFDDHRVKPLGPADLAQVLHAATAARAGR